MDDTTKWEMLIGVLIFAAGNVAYFEIRRLIRFIRTPFNKSNSWQDHWQSTVSRDCSGPCPKTR
jgi:hypothetical protein